MNTPQVTVYYDGLCPLCSREIAHYQKRVHDDAVHFTDITAPEFEAADHGLDPERIHQVMHVKVGGEVRAGVDAFIALWAAIPSYRWLARLARLSGMRAVLALGYRVFVRIRPWLPRRKPVVCTTGTCKR